MATKKIWAVYEVGASYEGPLIEVEASSEKAALDPAAAFFGVPREKLFAVPGTLAGGGSGSWGPRSHSTKKSTPFTSEAVVAQMRGRRVKSGWHDLVDGEILQWEPFGAGMTDVLVKDVRSGRLSWYASHGLTPIDGLGPLPSRSEVRKIREAEMESSMKKIGERWAKEPHPPRIRR